MTKVTLPGYPRIGQDRELKKAIEAFWKDASLEGELRATAASLRAAHWKVQERHGVRPVPTGDFSLYDTMLDAAVTFGAIPDRYAALGEPASLAVYFAMARGTKSLPALEMTKWFDTNYHYIVPEVRGAFRLHPEAMLEGIREARALGLDPKPVLPGPYTFLHLAKLEAGETVAAMLPRIVPFYAELLALLAKEGAEWVALDEPALVLDGTVPRKEIDAAYALLASRGNRPRILVQTYFADVRPHRDLLFSPVSYTHLTLPTSSERCRS
ncbi:MAG: 5-methyltetrahydropteroyltriglutamate--homocysteine S-methyltransferase, partial [Candidatus Eisenbacteria bacterium]|nr:5-methyltetrahydropteroyltriglutamate--homocysteine S-methyltransferase [Candidatus Eisenbacteria bacterium]